MSKEVTEGVSTSADRDSENVPEDEDRKKIREQLSTMSFQDLQKLKQKMGSKLYNRTVFGTQQPKPKSNFKRANKNRPREVSSKKRIKLENVINPVKKSQPRDPRFEPMCGTFDRKTFKNNYKFVNDLRIKEKKQLETELQETTDPEDKINMKFVIQRLDNQIREADNNDKVEHKQDADKKEINQKLKRGEKVNYKKKSVQRLEGLISKYEDLKKTNKLQKHMERRSKKLSVKERKKMERQNLVP